MKHIIQKDSLSDSDEIMWQYGLLKFIANEVFKREKEGDFICYEILKRTLEFSKKLGKT